MQQTNDKKLQALSQRIDDNHGELQKKLDALYQEREKCSGPQREEIEEQIRALRNQEIRLLKSKKAAWMAHWLRTDGEVEIVEHPYRKLGATLMILCAIALAVLGVYAWKINS
ncbi:hypothetical protein KO507_04430 [Gilvimarinus agarilyticus]|uniref:hypothetical protein n=1 Tax=Gilvimarinus sp. 2_MG-2023 TaxID=3062666 RepID=UPI001C0894D6|nr:hypothetical protein [Gilvimarinus sp. 2_MG-2023]MBU2885012.1 hypothetical protein [Gilvimarinus agarilyticus]MDO6569909.1 hypothetical protein [Gilvimarinus sp. 2_MG-2023]